MNRPRRSSKKKQEKKDSAKSAVYIVILIVALGIIAFFFLGEFNFRNSFNTIVNELDSGFQNQDEKLISESMEKLESLKSSNLDNKERLEPINDNLLKCYRHFSSNPGISHKERIVYLKKINEIAPDTLSKMDKELLEK